MNARAAWLIVLAGTLVACFGAIGMASTDGPHLSLDSLDPWLVAYALGILVALGAVPFVLHARFVARASDREERWELALAAWGGVVGVVAIGFGLIGLTLGFTAASASGAIAIVGLVACGLVLAGLALLALSG